ncbi:MAG: hypothetical protein NZM27_12990 [Acetobacteraceae bacterium]|nr:hypothetical protein [Acetobacteraceae bacterium]MDW8397972.1 hypothetical protein [Acetobacteraceae bacterium]
MVSKQPVAEPDPRLVTHLEPGERVLWQGWPEFAGLMSARSLAPLVIAALAFVAGPFVIAFAAGEEVALLIPVFTAPVVVLILVLAVWMKRKEARETVYAPTDRRALHVQGSRLRRAEGPEKVQQVRIAPSGAAHGDVYWRTETRMTGSGRTGSTRTIRVGFLGVPQPDAVAARVSAWKGEVAARSAELAARFADAGEQGRIEEMARAGDSRQIAAPALGVAFFARADWSRVDGGMANEIPLRSGGGFLQMVKAITRGGNTVRMLSPGGGAFQVTAEDGPPPQGFEQASQPRGGFQLISADPEVRIGPWRSYAVAHKVTGVKLFGVTLFASDVLQREIWLDLGGRHLLVKMAAPAEAHDVQRALDAMAQTLRPA